MSLAQTESVDAFIEARDVFGVSITIKEQEDLICLVSKDGLDTALGEGGFVTSGAVTVRVLLSELEEPLPIANDPMIVSGQRYKIHEIDSPPESSIVKYIATRR